MKIFITLAYSILALVLFPVIPVLANYESLEFNKSSPKIELQSGDRIVFLGNSLFENDVEFGYIEFALSTRWAGIGLTFRNLGWSGDTVFAEARGYYTNPPGPYELLIQQIKDARPTQVFLAYGAIESEAGGDGIPAFEGGLNRLLDSIQAMGAQAVLLSPLPPLTKEDPAKLSQRRNDLKHYASVLASTAKERQLVFVDIFSPFEEIQEHYQVTDDGLHLNEEGYYHLAAVLEKELGVSSRDWSVKISLSTNETQGSTLAEILEADVKEGSIKFSVKEEILPIPSPFTGIEGFNAGRKLLITGLKRGYYVLTMDGTHVIAASAKKWSEGVAINQGPSFEKARRLRKLIIEKSKLFFHQYRPPNRTYILGFRSYEQGRHVQGLEELGIIIKWLEGQIDAARIPTSNIYQLTPVQ